jgi:hypothetical protein
MAPSAKKAAPKKGKPAILSGQPRARRLMTAGRTVKLLRAVCKLCDTSFRGWQKKCPHNPYIGLVPKEYKVPKYEDILDDEGNPTGRKKVVGTDTEIEWESRPNWKEVTVNERLGGLTRVGQALGRGCIFPEDVRSPEFPDGIAPTCEFRGCRQQTQPDGRPLIKTSWGNFCREIEAKFARIDQTGFTGTNKRLEVGFNTMSLEKQRKQLEATPIG